MPFLIKPPAGHPVRIRCISEAMAELIDFPATVYDLAGIDPGYPHVGRSLLPLIAGQTDVHRDAVFCEGGRLRQENHCKGKATGAQPEEYYWPRTSLQHGDGVEHSKAIMCRARDRYKYVRRLDEEDEFYDLAWPIRAKRSADSEIPPLPASGIN